MEIDKALQERITSALASNRVANAEDLVSSYSTEIVMRANFTGYFNPRMTAMIDEMSKTEVGFVKFTPMVEDGILIISPAAQSDLGATHFVRSDSRRTARVNMRLALLGFTLNPEERRKLRFTTSIVEVGSAGASRQVLVVQVKTPGSIKVQKRASKKKSETPAVSAAAAAAQA